MAYNYLILILLTLLFSFWFHKYIYNKLNNTFDSEIKEKLFDLFCRVIFFTYGCLFALAYLFINGSPLEEYTITQQVLYFLFGDTFFNFLSKSGLTGFFLMEVFLNVNLAMFLFFVLCWDTLNNELIELSRSITNHLVVLFILILILI